MCNNVCHQVKSFIIQYSSCREVFGSFCSQICQDFPLWFWLFLCLWTDCKSVEDRDYILFFSSPTKCSIKPSTEVVIEYIYNIVSAFVYIWVCLPMDVLVGVHACLWLCMWMPKSPECHFTDTVHIVIFGNRVSCSSGAHPLDLAGWLLRPKERPIFTSLALVLQANMNVSRLVSKHFIGWAILQHLVSFTVNLFIY